MNDDGFPVNEDYARRLHDAAGWYEDACLEHARVAHMIDMWNTQHPSRKVGTLEELRAAALVELQHVGEGA